MTLTSLHQFPVFFTNKQVNSSDMRKSSSFISFTLCRKRLPMQTAAGVTTQAKRRAVRQLHRDVHTSPVHVHVQKCSCELAENSDVKCFKFFLTAHKQKINTSTATATATAKRGRHKKKKIEPCCFPLGHCEARKHKSRWNAAGFGQSISCFGRGEAEGGRSHRFGGVDSATNGRKPQHSQCDAGNSSLVQSAS